MMNAEMQTQIEGFSGSEFELLTLHHYFVQGSHSWMMVDGSMSALVNTHIFGNEYGDAGDTVIKMFGLTFKRETSTTNYMDTTGIQP